MVADQQPSRFEQEQRNRATLEKERHDQTADTFRKLQQLPDIELIALAVRQSVTAPHLDNPGFEMEMNRRLKDAIEKLTGEIVTFRESAIASAEKADVTAGKLTTLTRWLIGFTAVLVILTVVIVILTVKLLHKG
jgi:hypothetical protein